jgi:outer membrane protein insertion porin family
VLLGGALALAGIVAAHLPPGVPGAGAADLEGRREVRRFDIEGNRAFSDGAIRSLLRTRGHSAVRFWRSHPYRADFLRYDEMTLVQFYRRRGYFEFRVDSIATWPVGGSDSKVDVTVHVHEGPRSDVTRIAFEGVAPDAEPALRDRLTLRPGAPFDAVRLETDRQAIEDRYANLGYAAVRVRDSLEIDSTRAGILYRVEPGPRATLGSTTVEGNRRTRKGFVTRELLLRRGDWLSRERIARSQQRIYDSGYYADVQFERGPIDTATQAADLFITVRERRMAWVDLGLGYGTVDQLRLTSEWGNRNLAKSGMRFAVAGKLAVRFGRRPFRMDLGDRRVDVALSQPWFLRTRTLASVGGYAEEIPQLEEGRDFPLRAVGGTFTLRRELSPVTRAYVSLENRYVISDSIIVRTEALVGKRTYTTNRITATLERDARNDLFDPKRGSDLLGTVEVAGGALQGSTQFLKSGVLGSTYLPLRGRATFALRLRAGYITPFGRSPEDVASGFQDLDLIPVDDRFRTGGATSVRGYFENDLGTRTSLVVRAPGDTIRVSTVRGGEILLLGSIELRFPVAWILSGALFLDAGNVWDKPEDLSWRRVLSPLAPGAGYQDMRYSVGGGLRFASPVGPVRVDYGYKLRSTRQDQPDLNPRRGSFHFSLGQAF